MTASQAAPSRQAWALFNAAHEAADDEGLMPWTVDEVAALATELPVTDPQRVMHELANAWLVLPYRAGPYRRQLAWSIHFEQRGLDRAPIPSILPPPSIQNSSVWHAYKLRDCYLCHLCGRYVNDPAVYHADPYNPSNTGDPRLNASLDHVVPRFYGGTDYPSNIRLAHDTCNKARRERPIGASPSRHAPLQWRPEVTT